MEVWRVAVEIDEHTGEVTSIVNAGTQAVLEKWRLYFPEPYSEVSKPWHKWYYIEVEEND